MVSVEFSTLPMMGDLYEASSMRKIELLPAMQSKSYWVSAVLDYSTEYFNPPDYYIATQIIGPQDVFVYGDSPYAWNALCYKTTSFEPNFMYTEFIVVQYEQVLYPTEVVMVEVKY